MANITSQHILATSVNLLGFCLIIITSLHITNRSATTLLDEMTSVITLLLVSSCFCSFFSIRSHHIKSEQRLEKAAELLFIISLCGILLVIVFLVLNFIK